VIIIFSPGDLPSIQPLLVGFTLIGWRVVA
jgi:hypothetical protein